MKPADLTANTDSLASFRVGPILFQTGILNIALSAAATGTAALTFPIAYSSAPAVITSVRNRPADYEDSLPSAAGTTGFTGQVRHVDGASATVTVTLQWVAIGMA